MLPALLLAASLAAPRAAPPAWSGPSLRPGPLRLQETWDEDRPDEEEERRPHVLLSAWAGEAFANAGGGRSSSFFAGEGAWAFDRLDVGIQYAAYQSLVDATRTWTPVVLTRFTRRFTTRRGLEAAFSIGFGAGKPSGWIGWYQVALGMRLPLGPLFLGGELAFEQYDIIRLGAGLGLAF